MKKQTNKQTACSFSDRAENICKMKREKKNGKRPVRGFALDGKSINLQDGKLHAMLK